MQIFVKLIFNCQDDSRMPVTNIAYADSRDQVNVFLPGNIINVNAFA